MKKCYSMDHLDWSEFQDVSCSDVGYESIKGRYKNKTCSAKHKKSKKESKTTIKSILPITKYKEKIQNKVKLRNKTEKEHVKTEDNSNTHDKRSSYIDKENEKLDHSRTRNFVLTEKFIGWKV